VTPDYQYMKLAVLQANKAYQIGEVPVGIIVADPSNLIVFQGHNLKENDRSIFGHAEMSAIEQLSKKDQAWRLCDYTFYVTLEPCIMCMASLIQARIKRLVFGAYDPKGGAISLGYNFCNDKRLNHSFQITGGLLEEECAHLLKDFFRSKRK
jgi:tRNA(adenine34) deaminase